jgi:hypothetical protein
MANAVARIAQRLHRAAPQRPVAQQRWTPAELIARIEAALAERDGGPAAVAEDRDGV